MNLAPLLSASPAIKLHVATVIPAFFLGTWLLVASRKGMTTHRVLGYVYFALMTVTAITAIFIRSLTPNAPFFGFSTIHLLVPLTLYGLFGAIYYARKHDIRQHKRAMTRLYIGALVVAGLFTFVPGRIMYRIFFGN